MSFLEWLAYRENQNSELLIECTNSIFLEAKGTQDIEVIKSQINGMFNDAISTLLRLDKISEKEHVRQARQVLKDGYDWWVGLIKVMREYPYKGPDLYDAATTLAGDLWENVFNPKKYSDRNPPLAIFHKMASIRGQDIAFRFFGWRRKLKTASYSDLSSEDEPVIMTKGDAHSDVEWKELQHLLRLAIENEASGERNKDRAKRAADVMNVKLHGHSKLYNKSVTETGLDSLANFYRVNRREMYDTLLLVYRAVRSVAKDMADKYGTDDFLNKVLGNLPSSLTRDPEETVLSLMPEPPKEISHSELFTKAYSTNRELKSLTFKRIIQNLLDRNQINTRRDNRSGKHQTLYSLA